MTAPTTTLLVAASRYCAARERVAALTDEIARAGQCSRREDYEPDTGWPGHPGCYGEDVTFWKATPEQVADFCDRCRAQVPLRIARYAEKRRLAGLMRAMRMAYRRELSK